MLVIAIIALWNGQMPIVQLALYTGLHGAQQLHYCKSVDADELRLSKSGYWKNYTHINISSSHIRVLRWPGKVKSVITVWSTVLSNLTEEFVNTLRSDCQPRKYDRNDLHVCCMIED